MEVEKKKRLNNQIGVTCIDFRGWLYIGSGLKKDESIGGTLDSIKLRKGDTG